MEILRLKGEIIIALTRKSLKAMGLTDEQVDSIIEMHTETVDCLKQYKSDAEQLPEVQRKLHEAEEALRNAGNDGYKEKYENEHRAFEDFKAEVSSKETKAAKEAAVRSYFESKNIKGANLNIAMRSSSAEIDAVEVENGKIKDTSALDALVSGDYAGLVTSSTVRFDMNGRLNNQEKPITKEEIMSIKDGATRRKAMLDNPTLFGLDKK